MQEVHQIGSLRIMQDTLGNALERVKPKEEIPRLILTQSAEEVAAD